MYHVGVVVLLPSLVGFILLTSDVSGIYEQTATRILFYILQKENALSLYVRDDRTIDIYEVPLKA